MSLALEDRARLAYLASQWEDGDCGFIGIGSGGRAHYLATLLPIASAIVARIRGKDVKIQIGPLLGVDTTDLPESFTDSRLYRWAAEAFLEAEFNLMLLEAGRIDLGFISCAQIDKYGQINVNSVVGSKAPVRLGGALAVPELCSRARKTMVVVDLGRRAFVKKVDYVTGVLRQEEQSDRSATRSARSARRVVRVVTEAGVFQLTEDGLVLSDVFSHSSVDEIEELVSFEVLQRLTLHRDNVKLTDSESEMVSEWLASALMVDAEKA